MSGLDYEIIDAEFEFQVWTPGRNGPSVAIGNMARQIKMNQLLWERAESLMNNLAGHCSPHSLAK